MATKAPTIEVFMTSVDEAAFSAVLAEVMPEVVFVAIERVSEPGRVRIWNSLDKCGHAAILNTNIVSLDSYRQEFVWPSFPGAVNDFTSAQVGPGLVQYLPSKPWDLRAYGSARGLRSGRLAACFDPDPQTAAWVSELFAVCRNGAIKVNAMQWPTMRVDTRHARGVYAWPDAVACYDQTDGQVLMSTAQVFFTTKGA